LKVLVIDNYDSFVYNLVQCIGELGSNVIVYRNNRITLEQMMELNPDRYTSICTILWHMFNDPAAC
jgi:anthranilate/para-aminobenzoate synthase component II